ncbi:MAG: flagellar hook capping FlgD N-terminal domain-containing protein [Bacteroidota bacterium]
MGNPIHTRQGKQEVTNDRFLRILTYQSKPQDSLKPSETDDFTTQLAQFSQLEQLIDIRSILEEQAKTPNIPNDTIINSALPGMLGKNVKALSDTISFSGEDHITLCYSLNYTALKARILLKNTAKNIVNTILLSKNDLIVGNHIIKLEAVDSIGNMLQFGKYTFQVNAIGENDLLILAKHYLTGKIQAVNFKPEGTMLVINGIEIALENVVEIS